MIGATGGRLPPCQCILVLVPARLVLLHPEEGSCVLLLIERPAWPSQRLPQQPSSPHHPPQPPFPCPLLAPCLPERRQPSSVSLPQPWASVPAVAAESRAALSPAAAPAVCPAAAPALSPAAAPVASPQAAPAAAAAASWPWTAGKCKAQGTRELLSRTCNMLNVTD